MAITHEISFEIDCSAKKVWEVLTHPASGAVINDSYQYLISNKELMTGTKLILGIKRKNKTIGIPGVVKEFTPYSNFSIRFGNPLIIQESAIRIIENSQGRSVVTLQTIYKGKYLFFFKSKIRTFFDTEKVNIQKKCEDLICDFMNNTYVPSKDFLKINPKKVNLLHTILNVSRVFNIFSTFLAILSLLAIGFVTLMIKFDWMP